MRQYLSTLGVLVLCSAASLLGADNPFAGRWKLDASKSQLAGETFRIESTGSGMYRMSSYGQSATFALDGKQYPGFFDRKVSFKQSDPNTWDETVTLKDGTELVRINYSLSSDGKTLTQTVKGKKPNGDPIDAVTVSERVGAGSGMTGTWKDKEVKDNNPNALEFVDKGPDGLGASMPDLKVSWTGKPDGEDIAPTGPTVPDGLTLAWKKTGDRSMDFVQKMKGQPIFKSTYTVSDDGQTLTITGSATSANEPTTEVYVRE